MRELKFRAWVKSENCYMGKWLSTQHPTIFSAVNDVAEFYGDDDLVVEQYTGLKDKNGKEIYEGDIVDYNDDGECIGIVKYDAPEFYLDADATNWARMFLKGAPHQRVIGNIHENSIKCELTEEDKAIAEKAAKMIVDKYGEVLKELGNE